MKSGKGRGVSLSIKVSKRQLGYERELNGKRVGLTRSCSSSASPGPLHPRESRCQSHTSRCWVGPQSALKGLSDWVLPSLMSITLCLTLVDPAFDLPVCFWKISLILAPSYPHQPLLTQVWEPTSWLLLDVESKNSTVCSRGRELGDCDTMEHRDTAWRAVSPSGGLHECIFSMGGPAWNVDCEFHTACRHMCMFAVSGYRLTLCLE